MSRYTKWKSWDVKDFAVTSVTSASYFSLIFSRFFKGRRPINILEIGYGNGEFLGWCRQAGFEVSGVEADSTLVMRARDNGFKVYTSLDEIKSTSLDVIFLFDVLEHIPQDEIEAFLEKSNGLLRGGGRIVIRTPNAGSPLGLANQYGDPTHVTAVTSTKLHFWAEAVGLEVLYSGRDLYPVYNGRLSKLPSRFLKLALSALIEKIFRFVFAPQSSGVLSANLLSVLVKSHVTQ